MDFAAIAKDFGFPVLCVVACGWFIRWLVMDRIKALEVAFKMSLAREAVAQEERIKAADRFARVMQEVAEKTTRALERNTSVAEKNQEVLGRLLDQLGVRPCLAIDARMNASHQDQRPPSSADIPAVEPATDRTARARAHA